MCDPGKVSSPNYACGNSDAGGVHTNSGVPNHAFAMIVDGTQFKPAVPGINQAAGTYNGQTITGIGLDKASAIYYRAQTVYQTPTTYFAQHDTAIQTSGSDLIGAPLKKLSTTSATGADLGSTITAADCQQVAKAMLAVEMSKMPRAISARCSTMIRRRYARALRLSSRRTGKQGTMVGPARARATQPAWRIGKTIATRQE